MGLGRPDKIGLCRFLEQSKHSLVTSWKFYNFVLYTIYAYISNIPYTFCNLLSCFAVTSLVYTLSLFVFEMCLKYYLVFLHQLAC